MRGHARTVSDQPATVSPVPSSANVASFAASAPEGGDNVPRQVTEESSAAMEPVASQAAMHAQGSASCFLHCSPNPVETTQALAAAFGKTAPHSSRARDARACFDQEDYQRRITAEINDGLKNNSAVAEAVPVLNNKQKAMAKMRSVVSQNKVRFKEDGFDLDLTYITPRIIAMGFPSTGRESYYRNPMPEVERFFEKRHAKHFRVYNLCRERVYDEATRFGGSFVRYPFDDHNAPSNIALIPQLVHDAMDFLAQDDQNVVAIHCKAGKGRTGLMISCLLMATDKELRSPAEALQFFSDVRTDDSQGVTIPSQKRYVGYWDVLLRDYNAQPPPHPRTLYVNRIVVHSIIRPKASAPVDVYFTVRANDDGDIFDSRKSIFGSGAKLFDAGAGAYVFDFVGSSAPQQPAQSSTAFTGPSPRVLSLALTGDIKITFFVKNKLMADDELFHFWFNTTLCSSPELSIPKLELDGGSKDKKHQALCANLSVDVITEGPRVVPPSEEAAAAGAAAPAEGTAQSADRPGKDKKSGFFSRMFSKNPK